MKSTVPRMPRLPHVPLWPAFLRGLAYGIFAAALGAFVVHFFFWVALAAIAVSTFWVLVCAVLWWHSAKIGNIE